MQISKLIPAVCAAAVCASFIAARAQDNPAQAAARAALMEKMNELEAQPAQPAPPPIVVTPAGARQVQPGQPTNAVAVPTPAVHAQPAVPATETKSMPGTEAAQPAPATSDAEAQAKAKAALEQKMSEMNKENWATPAVAPAAPAVPQTQPVTISPVKPAPPAVKPAVMSPPSQINANYPGKELGLKPIVAPPLPISAAKEARLQALLEQYKADQITPKEYHDQRAAILAEP
ncbi:MAG: hypothetical protein WBW41_18785 [Verrucomicrobiia bacterium]